MNKTYQILLAAGGLGLLWLMHWIAKPRHVRTPQELAPTTYLGPHKFTELNTTDQEKATLAFVTEALASHPSPAELPKLAEVINDLIGCVVLGMEDDKKWALSAQQHIAETLDDVLEEESNV
jgi:hypothetical protein